MLKALASHTTLRLGGPARHWVDVRDEAEFVTAVREAGTGQLLLLGGGSNLLVADDGFDGTVVRILSKGMTRRDEGDVVSLTVQAGHDWDDLVATTVRDGLTGIECLSGIPGKVGAAPIQNIGAYGQCLRQTLCVVRAFDRASSEIVELRKEQCGFGYRASIFKEEPGRYAILTVELRLHRGEGSTQIRHAGLADHLDIPIGTSMPLATLRESVLGIRRDKGMVLDREDRDTYSAGSFFLNPRLSPEAFAELLERIPPLDEVLPYREDKEGWFRVSAAWLIEAAGFRRGQGNPEAIALSGKHVLALTNRGAGTTAEAVELAQRIAARVWERFGVTLRPEPFFAGHEWQPVPATIS